MGVANLIFLILCFLGLVTINDHLRAIRNMLNEKWFHGLGDRR